MLDDPCDFCPAFLSETELRVLDEMSDGELVLSAPRMASRLALPVDQVRAIVRRLRALGLAVWGNLTDDEGRLAGRGTWLNGAGCALHTANRERLDNPDPVEHALERGWFLEIFRRHKGDRHVLSWAWTYVFRRNS